MERGAEVDCQDCIPLLVGGFLGRRNMLDAGVVHHDVDTAVGVRGLPHSAISARIFSIRLVSPNPSSTTVTPELAKTPTMPSPMPLVDPVTIAISPSGLLQSPDFEVGSL